MDKRGKISPILLFLTLLTFLVSPVYSALATIDKVVVFAPSSANVGQEIQVQATVATKRSGWGTCTVSDVQAVLILPDGANVTSGANPTFVGKMNGGTSTKVTWTIVFEKKGTHTLEVRASGYDSNGNSCAASKSTVIIANGPLVPFEPTMALMAIGIFLIVVLAGVLMLRRRRRSIIDEWV